MSADAIYKGSEVIIAGDQLIHKITGKPINGTVEEEYHKNGKLKKIIPCVNGFPDGIGKEFYESGKVYSEIEYSHGINIGTKYYHENGNVSQESKYKVEKRDGRQKKESKECIISQEL